MPLSLAWIAAHTGPPIRTQLHSFAETVAQLARWLERRTRQIEPLWWRTRAFPIVQIRSDAVTAWIERGQHGALRGLRPAPTALDGARAGWADLVRGLRRPSEAIAEAHLLPDLLTQLDRLLGRITDAITDFAIPRADHFDPRRRSVFDLFGQAALVGGTVLGGVRTLMRIRDDLGKAQSLLRLAEPPGPRQPPDTSRTLAESLDMGARYILGAILLLPQLPGYLGILIDAAGARLHDVVQHLLEAALAEFTRRRRQLVDLVQGNLPGLVVLGLGAVLTARDIMLDNLRLYATFAIMYGRESAAILQNFLDAVKAYADDWIDTINTVMRVVTAVLDFDLVPVLVAFLAPPVAVLNAVAGLPLPHFTIGDWLATEASIGRTAARIALENWLGAVELAATAAAGAEATGDALVDLSPAYGAYHWIRYGTWFRRGVQNHAADFAGRVRAVRRLVHIALGTPAPLPPVPQGGIRLPRMPNLADTIFGPDRGAALVRRIVETRGAVVREVPAILGAAGVMLRDLAVQADAWSQGAAELGALRQYQDIAAWSTRLAGELVPRAARQRLLWNPALPGGASLGETFDRWLADRTSAGAIAIVVAALPVYVASLADLWVDRRQDTSPILTATSPHILARAARLSRVHVQALTVKAEGRPLDDRLLDEMASAFRDRILQAYRDGRRELDHRTQAIRDRERKEARAARRDARRPWPPPPERPRPERERGDDPRRPPERGGAP